MNNYNFKFWVERINCDNFRQKQVSILRNIIESGRLMWDMKFSTYAIITFKEDDEKHLYPQIEEIENYNRLRTNCLIYDLNETDANPGTYNKLIIYQTNGAKTDGYFGYVYYNTETREYGHKYYIDRAEDELCRKLHATINLWRSKQLKKF